MGLRDRRGERGMLIGATLSFQLGHDRGGKFGKLRLRTMDSNV